MRKRSSRFRHHTHQVKVLKSEVMSARIAWYGFLDFLKLTVKVGVVIGLLLAAAYGIRQAIEHTFHRNPDFRLQAINLTPNDVLDETDLVDELGIDLTGNIFDFDIDFLEQELLRIPGIATAKVERNLPGTLNFRITTRKPAAWIACPEENFPTSRRQQALLVDHDGFTYPCPPRQVDGAMDLPVIVLAPASDSPIVPGKPLTHPQYKRCLHLLRTIVAKCPEELASVDTISQTNDWSLELTTKSGTVATFGLGNHERQLAHLGQALDHARKKGYQIATINLIPRRNVPITVRGDDEPPRAIPVSEESSEEPPPETRKSRRSDDLRSLLNRN